MPFDLIDPDPSHLTGTINAVALDPDQNPNHVFERALAWKIRVNWSITGSICAAIGGEWKLTAFLESIGAGFEGQVGLPVPLIPVISVPLTGAFPHETRTYSHVMDVPANTPPNDGVYKLVVLVQHVNGGLRDRMAGFVEGPLLEFYSPQV